MQYKIHYVKSSNDNDNIYMLYIEDVNKKGFISNTDNDIRITGSKFIKVVTDKTFGLYSEILQEDLELLDTTITISSLDNNLNRADRLIYRLYTTNSLYSSLFLSKLTNKFNNTILEFQKDDYSVNNSNNDNNINNH